MFRQKNQCKKNVFFSTTCVVGCPGMKWSRSLSQCYILYFKGKKKSSVALWANHFKKVQKYFTFVTLYSWINHFWKKNKVWIVFGIFVVSCFGAQRAYCCLEGRRQTHTTTSKVLTWLVVLCCCCCMVSKHFPLFMDMRYEKLRYRYIMDEF